MPRDEFLRDETAQDLADRNLHIAIQCLLDIGSHVLAEEDLGTPERLEDIVPLLERGGALSPALAARLAGVGGLRNILVHDYLDVDHARVHQFLVAELDTLAAFAAEITSYLDRSDSV